MAKNRKLLERSRQAKIMRQKSREKARRQQEEMRGTVDEFQFFRRDLLPPDVSPTTWTRAQILHDLNGLNPGQALAEFVHLMVDPETMRAHPEGQAGYMTMAMNLWRIALAPAEMQERVIDELARAVAKEAEEQEAFRSFARGMVEAHAERFPHLHARVKQRRVEMSEGAITEWSDGRSLEEIRQAVQAGEDLWEEYVRPLMDAAGEDERARARATRLATAFSMAAREPLGRRAAALAMLRESLPVEDRAYFDETAPMMMRRYRELFAGDAPAAETTGSTSETGPEEAPAQQPATPAERPEEAEGAPENAAEQSDPQSEEAPSAAEETPAKRSLLGGLFRRGG